MRGLSSHHSNLSISGLLILNIERTSLSNITGKITGPKESADFSQKVTVDGYMISQARSKSALKSSTFLVLIRRK